MEVVQADAQSIIFEEGVVQRIPLGLEGLAVLGREYVFEASETVGRRG